LKYDVSFTKEETEADNSEELDFIKLAGQFFKCPPADLLVPLMKMGYMFLTCSFCTYLIFYQLKYLKGNIFTNSYYVQFADLLACIFGGIIYSRFGMKITFAISFLFAFIGSLSIFLI